MAYIEAGIIRRLNTATTVTALTGQRIRARLSQNETMPAIGVRRVSTDRVHAMVSDDSLQRVRIQVDCYATGYAGVKALAAAVKTRLSRFKGTVTGNVIQDVLLQNELDLEEERGEDARLWRVMQDYYVWHEE